MKAIEILLIVVALVTLLMLLRLRLVIGYDGQFRVQLRILFLRFRLYPEKKGQPKKKAAPKQKKPKEGKEKEEKTAVTDIQTFLRFFGDFAETGKRLVEGTFRRLTVDRLLLHMTVCLPDAALTAITYGEACGVIFPVVSYFYTKVRVKKSDVRVTPEFSPKEGESSSVAFECVAGIRLGSILRVSFTAGISFLKVLWRKTREDSRRRVLEQK